MSKNIHERTPVTCTAVMWIKRTRCKNNRGRKRP